MAEPERYPTREEFWRRLEKRGLEPDLRDELERPLARESQAIERLPEAAAVAVAARLVPGAVPARALAAFLDQVFDRQLGRADDKAGLLPRGELIPRGFEVLETEA